MSELTTTITWHRADEQLPDDAMTVLMCLSDREVWAGYHLDGEWHDIDGATLSSIDPACSVVWWADMPEGPAARSS